MTFSNYKGIIVALGLIGGSAALWFSRSDSGTVHAVDVAEEVAACHDCNLELSGGTRTNVFNLDVWNNQVFSTSGWESDQTVTNTWGGYQSFYLTAGGSDSYMNGTYTFQNRSYGSVQLGVIGSGIVGGAIDIYSNGTYFLFDCGPGGGSENIFWSAIPMFDGGWFIGYSISSGFFLNGYTLKFNDLTHGVVYPLTYHLGSGYTTTVSSVTYPTSGVSRIRYYNPTTLVTYTNTIFPIADQNSIIGIRNTVGNLLNGYHGWDPFSYLGALPYFIGPTNIGSTYDGVASFPQVSTSSWCSVYTNWTSGGHSVTNYATVTNHFPLNISVTYTNGLQSVIYGTDDGYGDYLGSDASGCWAWSTLYPYTYYAPTTPSDAVNYWESFSAPPCTLLPYDAYGSNLVGYADVYATPTNSTQISISTNIIACPNESMFIKTNELAWHYSALYRLRDTINPNGSYSNRFFFFQSSALSTIAAAWGRVQAVFLAGPSGGTYDAFGSGNPQLYPLFGAAYQQRWDAADMIQTTMSTYYDTSGWHTNYTVNVFMQTSSFQTSQICTNVPKTVEWYANVSSPPAAGSIFSEYGTPVSVTNVWKLVDTQAGITTRSVTTVYDSWPTFPPLTDAVVGQTKGYGMNGMTSVLRWQQRACNTPKFEGKYP